MNQPACLECRRLKKKLADTEAALIRIGQQNIELKREMLALREKKKCETSTE